MISPFSPRARARSIFPSFYLSPTLPVVNPFSNPEDDEDTSSLPFDLTRARTPSLPLDSFCRPQYNGGEFDPPFSSFLEPRPKRNAQLDHLMVVSFGISKKALIDDFEQWPELASELEKFSFKRYLGMVNWSCVFDPKDRWLSPQPPPEAPPETTQIYLIGSQPPSLEYFPKFIKEMYPNEAAGLCRAISTAPPTEAMAEGARPPYQIKGPPLLHRKLETGYLYTTDSVGVRTKSVTPYKSAEGTAKGWRIYTEVSSNCDDRFEEAEDKLWKLRADYKVQHNPEEPMPFYTLEGGKLLAYGIEHQLRLADYDVPVEVSLDIDVDEEIEDPCDFKKEMIGVRRFVQRWSSRYKCEQTA